MLTVDKDERMAGDPGAATSPQRMTKVPKLPPHQPRRQGAPAALENVRVVDFSRVLAGPFGTQILADLGAEVIKIESPLTGDDIRSQPPFVNDDSSESTFLISCNRNKKSVALDITTAAGREVALDLIGQADVLVENFTTKVMKSFGLDYESIAERFPRLIYVSLSAYGRTGRWADVPGLDPTIAAEAGIMAMNGALGERPSITTIPWVDTTVAMNSQIAILAALIARDRLGKGQHIDLSMYETAIANLSYIGGRFLGTGEGPYRYGRSRPENIPSGEYDCLDKPVYIYCMSDKMFSRICCGVLDRPELAEDPRFKLKRHRNAHADEIMGIIGDALATDTAAHWVDKLERAGVPAGAVNQTPDALLSERAFELGAVSEIPHPSLGTVFNVESPFRRLSLTPAIDPVAAPTLGQHTTEVLTGLLGYDRRRMNALLAEGVVKAA